MHDIRAGAPIRFTSAQAPEQQGYAQYPCLQYDGVYDFEGDCPAGIQANTRVPVLSQPSDRPPPHSFCWVRGTLQVSPAPHTRVMACKQVVLLHGRLTCCTCSSMTAYFF